MENPQLRTVVTLDSSDSNQAQNATVEVIAQYRVISDEVPSDINVYALAPELDSFVEQKVPVPNGYDSNEIKTLKLGSMNLQKPKLWYPYGFGE